MGECGCVSGNQVFKLKAPDGWYVIELMRGCDYCCHGPGIQIHHPEAWKPMDFGFDSMENVELMPDLPVIGAGEHCITMIKCGLDLDEAKNAAVKVMVGIDVSGDDVIDETLAEIFGEDFWRDALTNSPSVIYPKGESNEETQTDD